MFSFSGLAPFHCRKLICACFPYPSLTLFSMSSQMAAVHQVVRLHDSFEEHIAGIQDP